VHNPVVVNLFGSMTPFDFEIKYIGSSTIRTFKINKFTLFNHFNLTLFKDKHLTINNRKHFFFLDIFFYNLNLNLFYF